MKWQVHGAQQPANVVLVGSRVIQYPLVTNTLAATGLVLGWAKYALEENFDLHPQLAP